MGKNIFIFDILFQMLVNQSKEYKSPDVANEVFGISPVERGFRVTSPLVKFNSRGQPINFELKLQKMPTLIEDGVEIGDIIIDRESKKAQSVLAEARNLREIPIGKRPRKIMELLRRNVNYAYHDTIDELGKTDPELAKWVSEHTGLKSGRGGSVTLSQLLDSGFGVCRHLSAASLALGKEAGLEGAVMTQHVPEIVGMKNVIRGDNGLPLFKSVPLGYPIRPHKWLEFNIGHDQWIPVDPSVQLVGDSETELQIFRDANYLSMIWFGLNFEGLPKDVDYGSTTDLFFKPGEAIHTGVVHINSHDRRKPIALIPNPEIEAQIWPQATQYEGPLDFKVKTNPVFLEMSAKLLEVRKV